MTQSNTSFNTSSNQSTEPDAFPARLLAISTLQIIANSTQFTSIKSVSLQTFTQITSRYLQLLAESARSHADHSGRNQINAWDLVGVLEEIGGKGALASLHNWCLDQYSDQSFRDTERNRQDLNLGSDVNLLHDEPLKLATISKKLNINHSDSIDLNPITSLSFLPLTDSEVAELDKAGETDLEENLDTPSPAASSSSGGSSEEDSDLELPSLKPIEEPTITIEPQPSTSTNTSSTTVTENLIERWRSVDDIPSFVPAYFPPLPGLEKIINQVSIEVEEPNLIDEPIVVEVEVEEAEIGFESTLTPKQDPYTTSIPYTKSQLFEQYGTQAFPRLPSSSTISLTLPSPPQKKKIKLDSTLECFQETYSFCLEENRSENPTLKANPNRLKYLNSIQTNEINTSLFTNIPIKSIRSNRWSAGWIPHPPVPLPDHPQGFPELRPFGHTPLPTPLTMSVPIEFPSPNLLIHPSQSRIPSLIPTIFKSLDSEMIKDQEGGTYQNETFTILNRLTRLGPPCELGQSGEPTTYRIKADDPTTTTTTTTTNEGPKYMEWGFHWPSNHGHEAFKSKETNPQAVPEEEEEKFVNASFPVMPKTSVEKARILELQEREREINQMKVDQVQVQVEGNHHHRSGNVGGGVNFVGEIFGTKYDFEDQEIELNCKKKYFNCLRRWCCNGIFYHCQIVGVTEPPSH
ncbi:uncharacterized protein MELLADRAFT_110805 [Melampsora larici-populina 98AG31]|uniref:Bromodomain associated domain-containing protein n=1 Tax=Melampsora larici-populina (strain 98AG31 / pathotype 3-4-7) TaxID=747676 RepID=F4S115_MELLP|nr:uncharacterized protein MELLADRAFT_110805 [Melampsora larici-populina 98AG31]EGG01691.1 hypothetical protein MELLADRAFT_110805 [Melampsora larici-populina 98AG31]